MTKDEIKELQTNLISLVPSDIRKSKELTKSDKILLGQLVFLYGMNKAKENGYVFRTNALLKEDTQLSKRSVSLAISHLIAYGAINRTVGSRADGASVYTLNFALPQNGESSPITSKVALKSSPINQPYVSRAEVEAMIEGLRAEYEQQISELRDELATLKGMKSAEVALKSSPINGVSSPKSSPQIQNTDIETYHSVPEGNYRVGDIYTRPDGKKNDEAVETVESVCDFQKNRVEGEQSQAEETTPNATANEIETPKAKVTPEERIKELDNLQLWKMQTPNVDPIEIATELGEILTNEMYESHTYKEAAKVGAYLIKYANDIETLNQIEERLLSAHREKYDCGHPTLDYLFNERRKALTDQTANKAAGSVDDTAEVQTTIDDEKTQQGASQRANQWSGDTDTIPHDGETSQTSENKASGSVLTPQMGKLSTDTDKTRQIRPDEAREAMTVDIPTDRMLTKIANLNEAYEAEEDMEARNIMQGKANKVTTKMCDRCGELASIECVNWGLAVIPKTLNQFGKILGTMAGIYLKVALNTLNRRREELLAA